MTKSEKVIFFLCPWKWPTYLIRRLAKPLPPGLWVLNWLFQRVFGLNRDYAWPINFTSRVIGHVKIGKNVWKSFAASGGCYIQGGNGIEIGEDTLFGPGVKIISANHNLTNLKQWEPASPVIIGERCWIGANTVILPEVVLGDDVVVAAGAIVTQSYPAGAIVAGTPAKLIKFRPGFEVEKNNS
jgi:carbonic anhydrase/acetyltransferase-like protein (isoleucine patch superfamily)